MTGGAAWGAFEEGFYDACEELGYEGHYLAPTTNNDWGAILNLHETAITNGADTIMDLALDPAAYDDILQRGQDEGVILLGLLNDNEHNVGRCYGGFLYFALPYGLSWPQAMAYPEVWAEKWRRNLDKNSPERGGLDLSRGCFFLAFIDISILKNLNTPRYKDTNLRKSMVYTIKLLLTGIPIVHMTP